MILNYIWEWGFIYGSVERVEYLFNTISLSGSGSNY